MIENSQAKTIQKNIYMNANRLIEARKFRGLSQRELGEALGITDSETAGQHISKYERGVRLPPYKTVREIAKILDMPPCYFYIDDDDLSAEEVQIFYEKCLSHKSERRFISDLIEKNQEYEKVINSIKKTVNSVKTS
ncbi:helix-turn-helix transcriptional regulator [Xenorhabdus nematophila]|uniref:DNA binding protein n=1 Tax=Xenorhabdus nematophila (strain ATCC 19061 / DSM 3370 / CCUG 14189 / LMG 1036 / NCIMB 9965 / AN6) TaxID=406817 RepID=D3VM42_XENNA|nr:helix-turn-helix transcriptional regulator [Xenorhabdus nematophila]CBJ92994.1 putative DNA binding protein [Xenorhabdus nematophila ATCC 19061]CEK25613.1 putative DNA binding protein [Xenorhabdus nematophila AN6/1]